MTKQDPFCAEVLSAGLYVVYRTIRNNLQASRKGNTRPPRNSLPSRETTIS